ncbi:hypothetical protein [Actinomycetospora sp. CA-084318]|uniref:hypothetical protein n=1 Tax=Actinomycetospora sp. CA-084318 TaxID=3239892 RepID=UPI003D97F8CD
MHGQGDFYEDDEPVDELLAAFDEGEQGVTGPLSRGRTEFVHFDLEDPVAVTSELVGNAKRSI